MSFKVFFWTIAFLAILFVMLFVCLNNRQSADFYFPGVLDKKLTTYAALIYFGMFAVGVIAGMLLTVGGGSPKGRSSSKADK